MARDQGAKVQNPRRGAPMRPGKPASAPVVAAPAPEPKVRRPMVSPVQFWREVQGEARKITWTSWRETWITSVMVFIMMAIVGMFFLAVDFGLGHTMQYLYHLASS
jgi:preprotein translocase subunit SecE